jgi:alkyl hydroperoxide reductase subunit D
LNPDESLPVLLALATATQYQELADFVETQLRSQSVSEEKIREAKESAAIMSMLNFYYKFKHMLHKDDEYRQTGLRMTALANPVWGKQQFEMMAFAISVLNGCETCIQAHEQVLRDSDVSVDKIHDLARLTAVVKGLQILNIT